MLHNGPVNGQIIPGQAVDVLRGRQQPQNQAGRDELGKDRSIGNACNAHMEHQHKDQVQNDIQHAGQHQKIQRPCGISHGAQHGGAHIVDEQAGKARKIDVQVLRRLRKYVLRGGHQPKHGHNAHIADHGKCHTHDKRCGDGGLHRLMELFHILGAKVDADDHAADS